MVLATILFYAMGKKMNITGVDPQFEFRVFGQPFGRIVESFVASSPVEDRDEGMHTYILSATNQEYNVKIRDGKLDSKVLLRRYRSLERWRPYLQLPFPLTSAFLHEFLFAWLEVDPPRLARSQYTVPQLLQEIIIPCPHLCAVQVYKQRRFYTVNDCRVEVASLTIDNHDHTSRVANDMVIGTIIETIAVESSDADSLLRTIEVLGLDAFDNANYPVALRQLLAREAPPKRRRPGRRGNVMLVNKPEPVLAGS